ncbi:MAG: DUF3987 domain-containing protein [Bacteroidales bacterium]|nr:DUF3987 domain-containing protein [Bacteroidales bacterium]
MKRIRINMRNSSMSNNVSSISKVNGNPNESIKVGPVSYKGPNLKPVAKVGIGIGILGGLCWLGIKIYKFLKKPKIDIEVANAKSGNTINEHHEASKDTMAEDDNRTNNDIRRAEAFSAIRMNERRQVAEMREAKKSAANVPAKDNESLTEWINSFHARHPMPDYSSIPILASVLDGCPDDYKDAVLMSLLPAFGALGFSKVRALYLDGKQHSPSIQVIVEGEQGSGKGTILSFYQTLFERVINADKEKLTRKDTSDAIIQTAGINISQAKFHEVMANNQDVHIYAIETEAVTVKNVFKKSNGLSFDFLRKAFYNEPIYLNNMSKSATHGTFPVNFNYTFTGTPKAIASLINADEVDGGTASRICFAVIPEMGRMAPYFEYPSGSELDNIQDQIDSWRQKYCFQTVDGKDVACPKYEVNVDYVCEALQDWLDEQYNRSVQEGVEERNKLRMRIATIPFHCAIVLHMLAGEPQPKDIRLRRTVKELAVYIANYCMERYLSKFTDFGLKAQVNDAGADNTTSTTSAPEHRQLTQEEIDEWYSVRGTLDENGEKIGLGTIAKKLGVDKYSVYNSFNRYKRKKGPK